MSEGRVQQSNEGAGNEAGANEGAGGDGAAARAPANETKADKFRRLAKDRAEKVSARLELLMQVFEPKNNEYTAEQVDLVFGGFDAILKEARADALAKLQPAREKSYAVDLSKL